MTDGFYTYILKCSDGSLYTGWTRNLLRRLDEHNEGTASKYTRGRIPVKLVYFESHENRSMAMKSEARIKKLHRDKKIDLINNFNPEKDFHKK